MKFMLEDVDPPYAPPIRVLRVEVIGETAYIDIADYQETSESHVTTVPVASIVVDAQSLFEALNVGHRDHARLLGHAGGKPPPSGQ